MQILVTGGCGYVGSVLTQALLDSGHDVRVFDIQWFGNFLPSHSRLTVVKGDTRDTNAVPMDGCDAVFHLANVANDPCCDLDAKISWEVNALATMGLVEQAIRAKVKHFIYASSGSVYGVKDEPKVTEELSLVPISDYNKTKMISERILMSYMSSIPITIVRPATICGYSPRMRLDLSVNMLTMQALTKGKITVFGGNQTRPNIHLKDMVAAYLHFLALGEKAVGVYNAGFENISIMDIARMVAERVPTEIIVTESNDPRSYRQCSDKLLATGFRPRFGVKDGVADVIGAYKAGRVSDEESCYNIKTMRNLKL